MNMKCVLAASACAAVLVAAAPAAGQQATYWMDVSTASGMGAGMTPGMSPEQMMQVMQGGSGVSRTMNLYLGSKTKPSGEPQAQHLIPPALQMGPSLPLVTPPVAKPAPETTGLPTNFQRPQGKMLIYWGCGEHVSAGQPTVVDFANMAAGKMPPGFAAMVQAAQPPRQGQWAGYGEWPNDKDRRTVPAAGSLIGAHKVEGNYSPAIAFSLAGGQDFMPGLNLREAGALPSGAIRLTWTPAAQATGYALSMFGANQSGDVLVWTSASKATAFPNLDYLSPSQVKTLIASGAALPPSTSECTIPAEVVQASPAGMVMMIGYGPEAQFSDKPKSPTWTTRVRFKTTANLMLGMGGMMGDSGDPEPQPQPQQAQSQQPKKKRRGFGLGDIIQGATGIPVGD
jgi:hypothetical protein